jgi:hypothetical protein
MERVQRRTTNRIGRRLQNRRIGSGALNEGLRTFREVYVTAREMGTRQFRGLGYNLPFVGQAAIPSCDA